MYYRRPGFLKRIEEYYFTIYKFKNEVIGVIVNPKKHEYLDRWSVLR